uniref:RING-type domain-containing protein n=1 Tax=Steinernema glaseri TaxID=37863 RepID=A0A1I7ZT11_9BILA
MDCEELLHLVDDPHHKPSSIVVTGPFAYVGTQGTTSLSKPCIDVYDIRTKQRILSNILNVNDPNKVQLYKAGDNVKLLTGPETTTRQYNVIFDFQRRSLRYELEWKIQSNKGTGRFKLLSSNILGVAGSAGVYGIPLPDNGSPTKVLHNTTFVPTFIADNCYVCLVDNCKDAVFKSISTFVDRRQLISHKSNVKLSEASWRQTFVFDRAAFIVDMDVDMDINNRRIYLFMLDSCTLYDVTDDVNIDKDSFILAATQDDDAIYLLIIDRTQHTKIVKLPVNEHIVRSLTRDKSKTSLITERVQNAEDFSCPVCLQLYQIPKILSKCGHSICEKCEAVITKGQELNRTKTLKCPVCRVVTNLAWYEVLPTNWSLKNIVENTSSPQSNPQLQSSAATCRLCNRNTELDFFECSKCSSELRVTQFLVCASCVLKKHSHHISEVTEAAFVDDKEVAEALSQIQPPEWSPNEEEVKVNELACKVTQKMAKRSAEAKSAIGSMKTCASLTRQGLNRYLDNLSSIYEDIERGKEVLEQMSGPSGVQSAKTVKGGWIRQAPYEVARKENTTRNGSTCCGRLRFLVVTLAYLISDARLKSSARLEVKAASRHNKRGRGRLDHRPCLDPRGSCVGASVTATGSFFPEDCLLLVLDNPLLFRSIHQKFHSFYRHKGYLVVSDA